MTDTARIYGGSLYDLAVEENLTDALMEQTQQDTLERVSAHGHSAVLKKRHVVILQNDDPVGKQECSHRGDLERKASFKTEIPGALHNNGSVALFILHAADCVFIKGGLQSMGINAANPGQILFFFGGGGTVNLYHAGLSLWTRLDTAIHQVITSQHVELLFIR